MEQVFRNQTLDVSVRTVKDKGEVFFYANDVAKSLGYKRPRKAVLDHVWGKNKVILDGLGGNPKMGLLPKCHPDTVFLKEPWVYQLIFKSKLPTAGDFQQWVFEKVLPSIRKTGTYTVPEPKPLEGMQIRLLNETDLHYKVVEYIHAYYSNALIIAGLGEFQTSPALRKDGHHKGYTGGQPDIIVVNPVNGYAGFAIELKTPKGNGRVKDNQRLWLQRLNELGYRTVLSNDYTEIVLEINKYFQGDTHKACKSEIRQLKRKCTALNRELDMNRFIHRPIFHGGKY
jgi:prophage antirepressor-like protein